MGGPDGLNPEDPGVRLLGATLQQHRPDLDHARALLAVCGDVPAVGDEATRWVLDVREPPGARHRCVALGRALSVDVLDNVLAESGDEQIAAARWGGPFDAALIWPRAHHGMDFAHWTLAAAACRLRPGGLLLCAARKQKGAKRLQKFVASLLGDARVLGRGGGYQVFGAERGPTVNADAAAQALSLVHAWDSLSLGEAPSLELRAGPGVFSRRGLDDGTAALLGHLAARMREMPTPSRVIDLCAGVGPLALGALRLAPSARALAVESNLLALDDLRTNVRTAGLEDQVTALAHDGMPAPGEVPGAADFEGRTDLVLLNPPTHAPQEALARLVAPLPGYLAPGGRVLAVVNRVGTMRAVFARMGMVGDAYEVPGYTVLEARMPAPGPRGG